MTRLLGLNVLPKQHGFLYLCITSGFGRSLAVTFTAKATGWTAYFKQRLAF